MRDSKQNTVMNANMLVDISVIIDTKVLEGFSLY